MKLEESERKFLVKGEFLKHVIRSYNISQGYLSSDPERTVRVRIKEDEGYLTIKGKGDDTGITRFEWEKIISLFEAEQLMLLAEDVPVRKVRNIVPEGISSTLKFEVDVFLAENAGLILAEIEVVSKDQEFDKPDWLGKEVTGDPRYYNSYLSKRPYSRWSDEEKSLDITA